jgi:hypothetical protein
MSHTEKIFYDWNINKEFTNEQIKHLSLLAPRAVAAWRKRTGIEVYNDHGYWRKRKAEGGKTLKSVEEKGRTLYTYTLKQAKEGLKNILLWSGQNRIPYSTVHVNQYLIPDTGKLVTKDMDPYAGIPDPLPTEGLTGKELRSAQNHNESILKEKKEAVERKENALSIISAYREARRQLDEWKAAGGDPSAK